jgi:hypothetical protein
LVKGDNAFNGFLGGEELESLDFGQDFVQTINHKDRLPFRLSEDQLGELLNHGQIGVKQIEILEIHTCFILNGLMDFVIQGIAKIKRDVVRGRGDDAT